MANDRNWGGKRKGAGRKPGSRTSKKMPHRPRPFVSEKPIELSLTFERDINLAIARRVVREERAHQEALLDAGDIDVVLNAELRGRTIYFEAYSTMSACPKAVQRFATRVARRVNKAMRRRGRVFADRYRILTKPYVPPPPPTLAERAKDMATGVAVSLLMLGVGGAIGATTRRYPRFRL